MLLARALKFQVKVLSRLALIQILNENHNQDSLWNTKTKLKPKISIGIICGISIPFLIKFI